MKGIPAGADWMLLTYERKIASEAFVPPSVDTNEEYKDPYKQKKKATTQPVIAFPFHELCY